MATRSFAMATRKLSQGEKGQRGTGKGEEHSLTINSPLPLTLLPSSPVPLLPSSPFLPRLPAVDFFPVTKLDFDLPLGVGQIKMRHGL